MIKSIKDKKPNISKSVYVASNATVIGDVTIGEKSSVWFGSVVRGDALPIRIGAGTNIQDLCVLHVDEGNPLTIGDYVTVGHRAILHGCTIGNDVMIGMGATIMNGAVIGEGSIVGAGALVTEKTVVPPNSLVVGMPGKIRRETTDDERKFIAKNAKHYVEGAEVYIAEGL